MKRLPGSSSLRAFRAGVFFSHAQTNTTISCYTSKKNIDCKFSIWQLHKTERCKLSYMKNVFSSKKTSKHFLSTLVHLRLRDFWRLWLQWLVLISEKCGLLLEPLLCLLSTSISSVLHVSLLFTFRLGLSLVKWRLASFTKACRSVP